MSRTFHHGERRIRVRAIRNNPTDLRWFARALIELAQAQAMQPKGQPGGPGGAGPGVAGGPRPGAQPAPQRPAQQPPGAIHRDQMPLAMPRRA